MSRQKYSKQKLEPYDLSGHNKSIFDKIISGKYEDLTEDELRAIFHADSYNSPRHMSFTQTFQQYIRENKSDFYWSYDSTDTLKQWVRDKFEYPDKLAEYNSLQSKQYTSQEVRVEFYFNATKSYYDVHDEDQIYKHTREIGSHVRCLYIHHFTDEYIKNKRKDWKKQLRKDICNSITDEKGILGINVYVDVYDFKVLDDDEDAPPDNIYADPDDDEDDYKYDYTFVEESYEKAQKLKKPVEPSKKPMIKQQVYQAKSNY